MMKKNYNMPEIELISLDMNDVITTSYTDLGNGELGVNADNIF